MNWEEGFNQAFEKMFAPRDPLTMVDYKSLVVGGVDTRDYPDFCDAYFDSGYYLDGTKLPDDVLEKLSEDGELLYEHVLRSLY